MTSLFRLLGAYTWKSRPRDPDLATAIPQWVSADEVKRALDLKVQYDRCEELLPPAEKLVELLRETRLEYGHQVGIILGEIAAQARRRADRDPKAAEILGTLSDLLEYVSAPAIKANKTRPSAR
jgi:hypothetical protein